MLHNHRRCDVIDKVINAVDADASQRGLIPCAEPPIRFISTVSDVVDRGPSSFALINRPHTRTYPEADQQSVERRRKREIRDLEHYQQTDSGAVFWLEKSVGGPATSHFSRRSSWSNSSRGQPSQPAVVAIASGHGDDPLHASGRSGDAISMG